MKEEYTIGEFSLVQTATGEFCVLQGDNLVMSTGVFRLEDLIEACFTGEDDNFSDFCFDKGYDQRSREAHQTWVAQCDLYISLYNLSEDLYFAIRNDEM